MSSPDSGDNQTSQATLHQAARESLQQLRIAGIAVAVAVCGFMINRLSDTGSLLIVSLSIVASALAVAAGFLAWKMASRMFYAMAEGAEEDRKSAHCWKNLADITLWLLLGLAVSLAAINVLGRGQLPSEPPNKSLKPTAN